MKLNIDPNWLLRMTEKEDNRIVSVGGLVTRVEMNMGVEIQPDMMPSEWSRIFPLSAMRKLNFSLPRGKSDAEVLLKFFGVQSPNAWREKWCNYTVAFRQTQQFDFRSEALAAWVREAEIIANQIPLAEFDEAKLQASLNQLRGLTREDIGTALDQAQEICSRCGVALVVVPELPGTRISGCARWLTESHAMVGLTLRYKSGEQFWFTFFHELGHILLHRHRQLFVVDNAAGEMGDEVVDPVMAKYEEEADRFAADTLIPPAELAKLPLHKPEELTNELIQDFAKSIEIHPGTVIGRLQHDKVLKHWQGNKLKQKLEWGFVPEE
jgi:HTH-type transcriptional regulator / antitoxin HigA